MQKQDAILLLKEKIQVKETERAAEIILLKAQFNLTVERLKPVNLIKDAFTSPETKTTIVDAAIGMASGFITKKIVVHSSKNPLLKMLGTLVGMGVANVIAKHPEGVKAIGGKILSKIFNKEKNKTENS